MRGYSLAYWNLHEDYSDDSINGMYENNGVVNLFCDSGAGGFRVRLLALTCHMGTSWKYCTHP